MRNCQSLPPGLRACRAERREGPAELMVRFGSSGEAIMQVRIMLHFPGSRAFFRRGNRRRGEMEVERARRAGGRGAVLRLWRAGDHWARGMPR